MPLFTDVRTRSAGNVFKGLDGLVAVAPYATAALTTTDLFDATTGALKALPVGWKQIGWITTDGITQSRDTTISDTPAWGATEPILRTVTGTSKTLTVTAMEKNRTVDQLYYMADLSTVVAGTNNAATFKEPALPRLRDWRLLAMAKFENAAGEWYEAVQYPRASIQPNSDETWDQGDNGAARGLLATAQVDDVLGYAVEHFMGGPGFPKTSAGYVA
jgi:hypothetical protein